MSYIGTAMDRLPCVMLATLSSVAMLGGQDDDLCFFGGLCGSCLIGDWSCSKTSF